MNDMNERLHDLKSLDLQDRVSDTEVAADLLRGRSALRQRRLRWTSTAAVAGVAVAAVAGAIIGTRSAAPAQRHQTRTASIRLVAYTGEQQPGFTVTTVPAGYVLQGAQPTSLDIAPADDHSSLDAFTGKLVVMLQSVDAKPDDSGTPVTINGQAGYIRHGDVATVLEYTDGTHDIVVQSWNNIHLTDDQLVQFATGITVTAAVQATRG